jgi:hypothetical protein
MSRIDVCHTSEFSSDEPSVSSHTSGNAGEMLRSASSEHPMTLRQCLFVVGLFVLALVFSYLVVFRIDPFAVDLHQFTSYASSPSAATQGDRQ